MPKEIKDKIKSIQEQIAHVQNVLLSEDTLKLVSLPHTGDPKELSEKQKKENNDYLTFIRGLDNFLNDQSQFGEVRLANNSDIQQRWFNTPFFKNFSQHGRKKTISEYIRYIYRLSRKLDQVEDPHLVIDSKTELYNLQKNKKSIETASVFNIINFITELENKLNKHSDLNEKSANDDGFESYDKKDQEIIKIRESLLVIKTILMPYLEAKEILMLSGKVVKEPLESEERRDGIPEDRKNDFDLNNTYTLSEANDKYERNGLSFVSQELGKLNDNELDKIAKGLEEAKEKTAKAAEEKRKEEEENLEKQKRREELQRRLDEGNAELERLKKEKEQAALKKKTKEELQQDLLDFLQAPAPTTQIAKLEKFRQLLELITELEKAQKEAQQDNENVNWINLPLNDEGQTILHIATKTCPDLIPLLLARHADPTIKEKNDKDVLDYLMSHEKFTTDDMQAVLSIIKAFPTIDYKNRINDKGETLLYIAIKNEFETGEDKEPRKLLKLGVDPKIENKNHLNVLGLLIGRTGITLNEYTLGMDLIKEYHVDVNSKNSDANTFLHIAIKNDKSGIVPDLLTLGADPKIKNKANQNAFEFAKACKANKDTLEALNQFVPKQVIIPENQSTRKQVIMAELEKVLNKAEKEVTEAIIPDKTPKRQAIALFHWYQAQHFPKHWFHHHKEARLVEAALKSPEELTVDSFNNIIKEAFNTTSKSKCHFPFFNTAKTYEPLNPQGHFKVIEEFITQRLQNAKQEMDLETDTTNVPNTDLTI